LKFDIDDDNSYKPDTAGKFTALGISVPAEGVIVKVTLKSEPATAVKRHFKVVSINDKAINTVFSKYYVPATVKITQNDGKGKDTTQFTAVFDNDTSDTISDLKMYVDGDCGTTIAGTTETIDTVKYCRVASKSDLTESEEGNKLNATNNEKAYSITAVSYKVGASTTVFIKKAEFENFFESARGDDDLMVYSNKS
jgi:hypothetical protein